MKNEGFLSYDPRVPLSKNIAEKILCMGSVRGGA